MPIPWIVNNLYGLSKRRQGNQQGEKAFDRLKNQLQLQQQQPAMLGQPGPNYQNVIARAEAVSEAKGGKAGFEYLLGQTDPNQLAALQSQRTQNAQQGLSAQQAQQRHLAHMQLVESTKAGEVTQVPPQFATALEATTPREASARVLNAAQVGGPQAPTAQQKNYAFRKTLSDDEKPVFDSMFRSQQLIDTGGGGRDVISPTGKRETLVTPQAFGANEGLSNIEKQDLIRRYGKQVALPELEAQATTMTDLVDKALAHPGFDSAYGLSQVIPSTPGTNRADFETLRDQGGGQLFMQTYERLKGGGSITQVETEQGTRALATIQDPRQSSKSARQAWRDLRRIVLSGLERERGAARTSYGIEGPRATPQPGMLPSTTPQQPQAELPQSPVKRYVPGRGFQ